MKINNLGMAIMAYAESNLITAIPSSLGKWMTYAGLIIKMPEIEQMVQQYLPMFQKFGAINDTGDVDLEKLRAVGLAAFDKVPKIEIADFEFDRNDFEAFITFLSTQA